MSGFIANGSPPNPEVTLTNDGWFPDIETDAVRASLRMDGSVTNDRLVMATTTAMISVNRELAHYKSTAKANGHTALSVVSDESIGGEPVLVHLYKRAVYCTAGAEIAERYRSYDSTGSGNKNADDLTPSIDEYRRDARWAIRDLLGLVHNTVELI